MSVNVENLNSFMIDILKELGNIGAGNAATSLATMTAKKIDMNVPNVKILEFKDVANILGGEENLVIGIYFELTGDIKGNIMFVLVNIELYIKFFFIDLFFIFSFPIIKF